MGKKCPSLILKGQGDIFKLLLILLVSYCFYFIVVVFYNDSLINDKDREKLPHI